MVACAACGTDSASGPASLLPKDYAATYTMVRPCRLSGDHDLNYVTVMADSAAAGPYVMRTTDFPEGSLVVKEEHDPGDMDCSGPIITWTLMQRLATGSSPDTDDWTWQRLDAKGHVMTENDNNCISCHKTCGVPPDGYEGTCSMP